MAGRRPHLLSAALAAALAVLAVAAASATAAPVDYVDCQASPTGADGSRAHPWTTLADASSVHLKPGSKLLLRSGTECEGTLDLAGHGSKSHPALVTSYEKGPRPLIVGTDEDGIRLFNTDYTTLERLAITNPGDHAARKRGIHLLAVGETVTGVTVSDNRIHDVDGNLDKDGGGSGGIQVDSEGEGLGRFQRLVIADNRIGNVSRSGIFVVGVAGGERPRASELWPEASSGVRIRRNHVHDVAGDGIVTLGTDGALIRHNSVNHGNLAGRPLGDPQGMICNAGIWAFHANNTVIEHNGVSRMEFNGCDGSGYDIDYDQDGTVVQGNTSFKNEGGFMLLCTDDQPRTADVRFNVSIDDGYSFNSSPCSRPAGTYDGIRIYNNTIVGPDPGVAILGYPNTQLYGPPSLTFFNNILAATGDAGRGFTCEPDCHDNLFSNLPPAGTDAITGSPRFRSKGPFYPATVGFLALKSTSPAIGAGAPIPRSATTDYFGNPIKHGRPATIGFWQGLRR